MDEVSILRARISILERQMGKMNAQLREFIESFEEYRRHSRPFIPTPLEQQEVFGGPVAITLEDMEWDYAMAMLGEDPPEDDDDLS